jgi:cytoskeletal protein CcmA (bactofilin family)
VSIFGKNDVPVGQTPAPERPPAAPASSGAASGTVPATVIGAKVKFVGEISGDEDIVLQGRLEGNIRVNRKVTLAASGELQGDVHARWVVVGGRVHGQILADERVELLASASVQGNVQAPKVIIAEGAQLQGNVAMSPPAGAPASAAPKKVEV